MWQIKLIWAIISLQIISLRGRNGRSSRPRVCSLEGTVHGTSVISFPDHYCFLMQRMSKNLQCLIASSLHFKIQHFVSNSNGLDTFCDLCWRMHMIHSAIDIVSLDQSTLCAVEVCLTSYTPQESMFKLSESHWSRTEKDALSSIYCNMWHVPYIT